MLSFSYSCIFARCSDQKGQMPIFGCKSWPPPALPTYLQYYSHKCTSVTVHITLHILFCLQIVSVDSTVCINTSLARRYPPASADEEDGEEAKSIFLPSVSRTMRQFSHHEITEPPSWDTEPARLRVVLLPSDDIFTLIGKTLPQTIDFFFSFLSFFLSPYFGC